MTRMRAAIAALIVAIGAVLAVGAVQPAHAATLPIEYSTNGTTWQTAPLTSVYPGGYLIVPGGTLSSTLYFRSTDPNPVAMTIAVRDVTSTDPLLASGLSLSSSPSSGLGLTPTTFNNIQNCTIVAPRTVVAYHQAVSLTLNTTLSSTLTARNATLSNAQFKLVVGMSDPAANVGVAGCPSNGVVIPSTPGSNGGTAGTGGPSVVAMTGSDLLYPSLIVAAVALGIGWILVLVGRRRQREEPQEA